MTHPDAATSLSRKHQSPLSFRRWMPAMLGALALVASGPAAWAASTTTSLFTSPTSPSSGAVITMTAQVSSTSFTVAGGTVTFTDTYNGVKEIVGVVQVQSTNGAAGTAILKTEVGGVGTHQFVANYSGTQTFTASSSTTASVTFAAPYLTATKLSSTGTGPYALTGMVSAYGPSAPTGNISFIDSTTTYNLGTVALDSTTLQTGFAPYQSYPLSSLNNGSTGGTVVSSVGDFNNDGRLDYAVPSNAGHIYIFLGNGDGTFTTGTRIDTSSFTPTSTVVGDFNGDGKQDLAVLGAEGSVNIYLGNGDGTFGTSSNFVVSGVGSNPASRILAEGDFNRDGIQDLVATNSATNTVGVLLGLGTGSFLPYTTYSIATGNAAPGSKPWNVVVGDLNNDGYLDIISASDGSSAFSILQGKGDGTFKTFITQNTSGSQVGSVVVGDFNADGWLDVVTSNAPGNNIFVLKNTTTTVGAAPTFNGNGTSFPMAGGPYYLTVGDFNRDGKIDIISANNGTTTNSVGVLLNDGTGYFPSANTAYYQVGAAAYFANAADINGDDQIDLTAVTTNGVSVLLSGESESATLSNVTYQGCGTQAVVAKYNGDSNYGTSTSSAISVTPSTLATTLGLSIVPVNGVTGQQYTFTATLSPYTSGTYSTNGQTITFYANGSAFGTATLNNGVATLLYTPTATGSYMVYASYTNGCSSTGGFANATSSTIAATVKRPSTLTWNTPAAINYGTPLSATQLNATDSVPGTFTYTPAAGTVLPVGNQTLSVTFNPTDNTTYGPETATVTLQVKQASPVITWPTPTPITYGTPLSGLQLDATASSAVVQVPLSSYYNVYGMSNPGTSYSNSGFDNDGYSYSSATLSGSVVYAGLTFNLGPVGGLDAVATGTIPLPAGKYTDLYLLGAMVNNISAGQTFTVTYTDGTTTTLNQNMSDWVYAAGWSGETVVSCAEKRNFQNGSQQPDSVCVYGYDINLDVTKTVQSVTLPNTRNIVMLSMVLTTPQIPGTFTYSPAAGTVEPVGTDTLNVTFTPTDTTDYQTATASVNLTVTAPVGTIITPTINWPTPADITYGTALSSTQLNATAMGLARPTPQVPQDQLSILSTSTDGTAFALSGFDGNGDAYSYSQLNNGAVNYVGTTFTLGSPTVPNAISNGAVYTLSTPANYSTVYLIGAADKNMQNQPFVVTYTTGAADNDTLNLSSWTNPQGYAGETTVATTNYQNTSSGGRKNTTTYLYGYAITVDSTRALQSISVPNNKHVVILALGFGTNTQVVVPGTYAYTPPSGTVLNVGAHQLLSVAFTPTNTQAYKSASGSVYINVVKANPVINWPTPAAIAAGTPLSSTQLDATASVAGTFVYNPAAGTVLPSGTQTLKVTFTPNDTTDYNTVTAQVQIVVGNSATSITGGAGFQAAECCFFSQPTPYTVTLGGMTNAPTGTVSVTFGGHTLATGTLTQIGTSANSSASLLLNSIYLLVGNNTATINYLGDNNYSPSSTTAVITLRNPAIGANPATVNGSTSTLVVPFGFPVAGTMSFTYNPGGAGITDFTDNGQSTCSSGTAEPAGFVCTFNMTFRPALPGIRKEAIQVNFVPADGSGAEPILYLYLSGLGSAAQIALNTATQQTLSANFSQPQGLTFKPSDANTATLYVSNSSLGILDTLASTGGTPSQWNGSNTSSLRYPTDLSFDAFGDLIVADLTADKVFSFNASGAISTVSTGTAKLGQPTAARYDFANNLYIADPGAGTSPVPQVVMVPGETYDTVLAPTVLLNGSKVSYPEALAVDNTGNNLYVGDGDLNTVIQVALGTSTVTTIPISPCDATVTSCAFNAPSGIAFDPNNDMFVTDGGQRVLMIPANHSASAPTIQLPITGLNSPTAIALDGAGNVYVSDLNTSVLKLQVNTGTVKVGTSATTKVTNTGNQNLTITALTFGLGSSSFAETDNCRSASIAPGGSCTITFTNPRTVNSDTLTITSNAYSPTGVKINLTK